MNTLSSKMAAIANRISFILFFTEILQKTGLIGKSYWNILPNIDFSFTGQVNDF